MKLLNKSNVLLVAVLIVSVHSGCVERDRRETISESKSNIGSGITGFFSNLRCEIQNGARQVKETVEDGYNYVKQKLSTNNETDENIENDGIDENDEIDNNDRIDENIQNDDSKNNNNGTISILNNDRIIFKNDDEESTTEQVRTSAPIMNGSLLLVSARPVTLNVLNKNNVTVVDRNAISAPIVCPNGQRLVDQKCVPIVDF